MTRSSPWHFAIAVAACASLAWMGSCFAQAPQPAPPQAPPLGTAASPQSVAGSATEQQSVGDQYAGGRVPMLQVPVTKLYPGGTPIKPDIKNPVAGDPAAVQRGWKYFLGFNCVGCHADNGGGGMGPALSNRKWIYGSEPADIYLTIVQGRPNGMPAWGPMLPDNVVWDLVAYVLSISQSPESGFGMTTSLQPPSPDVEQTPAEFSQTATPWQQTKPFSNGQNPEIEKR
jgi:cytochrome c oxidase cbb3-type subunit III